MSWWCSTTPTPGWRSPQAEAALGQAERRVRGYFANDEALAAQVAARGADQARAAADVLAAQSALERARIDFSRRQALAPRGAVSGEELTAARERLRARPQRGLRCGPRRAGARPRPTARPRSARSRPTRC